jgi:hypothetical protein
MKVVLMDSVTSKTVVVPGIATWNWHKGNWSCDCNREDYFDVDSHDGAMSGTCLGGVRFVVVQAEKEDADDYNVSLEELNADYPAELVAKCLELHRRNAST